MNDEQLPHISEIGMAIHQSQDAECVMIVVFHKSGMAEFAYSSAMTENAKTDAAKFASRLRQVAKQTELHGGSEEQFTGAE